MLQEIAIHEGTNWSSDNKFQLNPVKCKKLSINFTKQPDAEKKISLDSQPFERVPQAKILGVTITKDLRWNVHIENIVKKASKRIYLLRQPKKADVEPGSLVRFYTTCIRSVVEYSCQVFHTSLLHYLSYEVELYQKEALKIIFPDLNCKEAAAEAKLGTLFERRETLYQMLFSQMETTDVNERHKLWNLLPAKRGPCNHERRQ